MVPPPKGTRKYIMYLRSQKLRKRKQRAHEREVNRVLQMGPEAQRMQGLVTQANRRISDLRTLGMLVQAEVRAIVLRIATCQIMQTLHAGSRKNTVTPTGGVTTCRPIAL